MGRHKSDSSGKLGRARALPWVAIVQALVAVGRRWRALSEKDRARLAELLRSSGGRPGKLSAKERKELRALVVKLDLKGMGRDLLALRRGRRGRRSRRARG